MPALPDVRERSAVQEESCSRCSAKGARVKLRKCPICFKMFCETCQVSQGGRLFCSSHCAHYFFWGEEE